LRDIKERVSFTKAFELLNEELKSKKMSLEIVCAGGYVMQKHGFKHTVDVDAFYVGSSEISDMIWRVGENLQINNGEEPWLNNAINNLNKKPPDKYIKEDCNYSNLSVKVTDINYVIGMKLTSGRDKDTNDVSKFIKHKNIEFFKQEKMINEMGFNIDI